MIALSKFQETQRLLGQGGLSQRKIAVMVGISRATVGAIAQGKYRDRVARQRDRVDDFVPNGPLERCPNCGGMVYLPCLVCRVRKIKDQEQRVLRAARRKARERAMRQLLHAVREEYWRREQRERSASHHLPAADATGPSDCR